ncbi:MAG: hypothetical protein HZB50_07310 [Chloroflexi bacterium]|nr:hypothetical protein [Chloroflexota bacterium]
MSNLKEEETKTAGELTSEESTQGQAGSFTKWLDAFLDGLYRNRREENPPSGVIGKIWGMPSISLPFPWVSDSSQKESYFLHYFQSQGYGPTANECVTTSALISMNMLKDWAALYQGHHLEADMTIEEYTRDLDSRGLKGWKYRFSTRSPLPGMMTPWQAIIALKDFAKNLAKKYGKSFKVELNVRRDLNDLIEELQEGHILLIHGAWQTTFDRSDKKHRYNPLLTWLGGMPHTMVLVGYDGGDWLILNPADPWPSDKQKPVTPKISRMNTQQLLDFWGRKFLFYPPRFSFTAIKVDA